MRIFYLLTACFFLNKGNTQTLDRWSQVVGWDGISHWSKYMIRMPAYLGPNALPVPHIGNGSIDSVFSVAATGQLYFSKGDNTQNLHIYANYCLVKNKISFDVTWVPVEFFNMSDTIKNERHVYYKNYFDKKAKGDLVLNTTINLLNKWREKLQLAIRLGVQLPSSSYKGLGAARFMDNMGYYVDVSIGKKLSPSLKWVSMLGLFVWQIDMDKLRQNDAFLFGTGLEWNKKDWRIQTSVSGYLGYIYKSGDKPIVYRFNVEKKINRTSLLLGFQQGLQDFKYSSAEFGLKYMIKEK